MKEIEKHTRKLISPRQLAVIPLLIATPTIEECCRRAKVCKPTLYKWLRNEVFKSELQRQREQVYKESLETLRAGTKRAVERLLELVNSKKEEIALRACTQIISTNVRPKALSRPDKDSEIDTPFTVENLTKVWAELEMEGAQQNDQSPVRPYPFHG